ncbi:MAG: serine/threonine-protein kinase [Myxococcota bacterium]|nr:serine/threonine-protein kinase [Myxococcota bacterium]
MAPQFAMGFELDQKYRIEKELGAGCFGVVYLATDLKIGRRVAVKVLHDNVATIERFVNEVEAIKRLEHEHIVRLYDIGWSNEMQLYMVTEFVEGVDLLNMIETEERISLRRTAAMALQLLDALSEAHKLGIIHCDLKPDNILITQKGVRTDIVKVLDFGVSKLLSRGEAARGGMMSGTPLYMAPEQVLGQTIGPFTDLYAVGLILYEMVIGEPAMAAASAEEVLKRQVQDPLVLPAALRGSELGAIIERACHKAARARYQSAEAMYRDLKGAVDAGAARPDWGTLNSAQVEEAASQFSGFDPLDGAALAYDSSARDSALAPGMAANSAFMERDILAPNTAARAGALAFEQEGDEPIELPSAADVLGPPLGSEQRRASSPTVQRLELPPKEQQPAAAQQPQRQATLQPSGTALELEERGQALHPMPSPSQAAPQRVPRPIEARRGNKLKLFVGLIAVAIVGVLVLFAVGLHKDAAENEQVPETPPEPPAPVLNTRLRTQLHQAFINSSASAASFGQAYRFEQSFVVVSIPVGARVSLNGEDMGLAPVELSLSTQRRATIAVSLKGYKDSQLEVDAKTLPPGQPIRVVLQR